MKATDKIKRDMAKLKRFYKNNTNAHQYKEKMMKLEEQLATLTAVDAAPEETQSPIVVRGRCGSDPKLGWQTCSHCGTDIPPSDEDFGGVCWWCASEMGWV